MKKGALGLGIVLGVGAVFLGVPMLMVMVLMGGQADLGDVCTPGSDSVELAAGTADGQLDDRQLANASAIVTEGYKMAVPRRAIVVALSVAHQESGFRNYANDGLGGDLSHEQVSIAKSLDLPHEAVGSDHGSLGVLQQQWPWWGSMPELMDPATAARKFYLRLLEVRGWREMSVTDAGQAVQRSAYPFAYADDQAIAVAILDGAPPQGDSAQTAAYFGATAGGGCGSPGTFAGSVAFPLAPAATYVDLQNWGNSGSHWESAHTGTDLSAACGTPVRAATDGIVTVRTDQSWAGNWLVEISTGSGSVTTWYAHMQAIDVRTGDRVSAGQNVGEVGDRGNATGCHLHFEVHPDGGEATVDPSAWLGDNVGHDLLAMVSHRRGHSEIRDQAVTLLTADVPSELPPQRARGELRGLLRRGPDVLLLQDVASRDINRTVDSLPGDWSVWQPPGARGDSAIVWDAGRFSATKSGVEAISRGTAGSAWMSWTLLESDEGTLPVVALGEPRAPMTADSAGHGAQTVPQKALRLVSEMNDAGYPPVLGGDFSEPISGPGSHLIHRLREVGLSGSLEPGDGCTLPGLQGVGGFAYNSEYLQVIDRGCLAIHGQARTATWVALTPN